MPLHQQLYFPDGLSSAHALQLSALERRSPGHSGPLYPPVSCAIAAPTLEQLVVAHAGDQCASAFPPAPAPGAAAAARDGFQLCGAIAGSPVSRRFEWPIGRGHDFLDQREGRYLRAHLSAACRRRVGVGERWKWAHRVLVGSGRLGRHVELELRVALAARAALRQRDWSWRSCSDLDSNARPVFAGHDEPTRAHTRHSSR